MTRVHANCVLAGVKLVIEIRLIDQMLRGRVEEEQRIELNNKIENLKNISSVISECQIITDDIDKEIIRLEKAVGRKDKRRMTTAVQNLIDVVGAEYYMEDFLEPEEE